MLDRININYFKGDHKGHCGYCDTNNSHSLGVVVNTFSPIVYQQMMDRGWRRCGTYYYKFNTQLSCCLAYTIRLDTTKYLEQRHSHRKIAKKFMQILQNPFINDNSQNFAALLKLIDLPAKPKQQVIQQKQQQPIKQVQQDTIDNTFKQTLLSIFSQFLQIIKDNKKEFIGSFIEYFNSKGINMDAALECFQLDLNIANVKIFTSQVQTKGDYYTNFVMLIYGLNKKLLFIDYPVNKFAIAIKSFIQLHCKHPEYGFVLEETGFLSIFMLQNMDKLQKHQIKLDKVIEKQKIQQEVPKQKVNKEPIKLINRDTFKCNSFQVGEMKVLLKQAIDQIPRKAELTDESFQLYVKYCQTIHEKEKQSKEDYRSFLCEQGLRVNLVKSQINQTQLLFLGCYHMCYYIQDKLVAVGVVDIADNVMSSVYFFYDPAFEPYNFGTFGALVEIEFIQILTTYFPDFKYYYLGFYIQNTNKMVYKGEYQPAELLCPETYTWVPLDDTMRNEIDARLKQQPKLRKLRIAAPDVGIINDMQLQGNMLPFYQNVKIMFQKQQYQLKDLNQDFIKQIQVYLDNALQRLGKKLMNELTFDL